MKDVMHYRNTVNNGVVLIKLSLNVVHYMQPLDRCVFEPIKNMWNNEIINFNSDFPA